MSETALTYLTSIVLQHSDDCCLLGVQPDLTIYSEEIYGAEGMLAQAAHTIDGKLTQSVDEGMGQTDPLVLPDDLVRPRTAWHTMALNFAGARQRGIRANEQIDGLVHPLTVEEKMLLAERLGLPVPFPLILGLAESYALAEAPITSHVYCVCRRLRIAFVLPAPKQEDDGVTYDYDTIPFYMAHLYVLGETSTRTLAELMSEFQGTLLHRPMDCLAAFGHLFIADGGASNRPSAVHVWRIDSIDDNDDPVDRRWQKLYG
ncbi:MAG: hypothetical protein IH587_10515 [Anaerolineae bacterium]|nr:hypothetical protein [Anaerolineae bacterium]